MDFLLHEAKGHTCETWCSREGSKLMDKAKKEASISVHAAKAYLALKGTAKRCEGWRIIKVVRCRQLIRGSIRFWGHNHHWLHEVFHPITLTLVNVPRSKNRSDF